MQALWDAGEPCSAYDLLPGLTATESGEPLAATTVLTVLGRLEKKGFVTADRSARPHRYVAVRSREDHVADLMHEVLGDAADRTAVLERFVGGVSAADADLLRRLLGDR